MNRSWNNKSNTSPGFVYFPQDTPYQNSNDSSDYLSFGNSPKRCSPNNRNRFSPAHYSSPRFKQNFNRYMMKQNHQYNDYNKNRPCSYNSSNGSFGSYDSYGSYSSLGSNESFRGGNRRKRKFNTSNYHNSSKGGKKDMSAYLDATCTTDPWMQLEMSVKEQKITEETNRIESCDVNSEDNSSSESSTESVSEENSSSSAVDEETA